MTDDRCIATDFSTKDEISTDSHHEQSQCVPNESPFELLPFGPIDQCFFGLAAGSHSFINPAESLFRGVSAVMFTSSHYTS